MRLAKGDQPCEKGHQWNLELRASRELVDGFEKGAESACCLCRRLVRS